MVNPALLKLNKETKTQLQAAENIVFIGKRTAGKPLFKRYPLLLFLTQIKTLTFENKIISDMVVQEISMFYKYISHIAYNTYTV